jgi:hypothetical protein
MSPEPAHAVACSQPSCGPAAAARTHALTPRAARPPGSATQQEKDRAKFGPEYGDRFCMLQLVGSCPPAMPRAPQAVRPCFEP